METTIQARPDAGVILPAHLDRPLTAGQRAVLSHLAIGGHLVSPMPRDYIAAARAAGYKTKRTGGLVRDLKSSPHFHAARVWLLQACAELDQRPMDRAEAVMALATVARSGTARERLAALAQLREMGGWDMKADGVGGTKAATVGGFAASIMAADLARTQLVGAPDVIQVPEDDDELG